MDDIMFMAFATERNEYEQRVRDCVHDIQEGCDIESALDYYGLEYADIQDEIRYYI